MLNEQKQITCIFDSKLCHVLLKEVYDVCLFVCFLGRPQQATDVLQPAGLLYRPLWTYQLSPPDVPAPTDTFRTLAAEVGTYGRE
jgi:hypothetical protein